MASPSSYDAVIVGAGPNGLAAAVEIARAGRSVLVLEATETVGGGSRSAELTEPGFVHDVCSAIHPLGAASPFFRRLPLDFEWVHADVPLAHPLDDGTAVVLSRSVGDTAAGLGADATRYVKLMGRLVQHADDIVEGLLSPLRVPRHPLLVGRFGVLSALSAASDGRRLLRTDRARALIAGTAAHPMIPLRSLPAHALWLLFHLCAHTTGWPMARGGSQAIADALAAYLRSLGGQIQCGRRLTAMRELPPCRAVLFDLTPRQVLEITGDELPARYRRRLGKFRYGPGVFKIDYALAGPIPWKSPDVGRAGTVHLGGTYEEIAHSENIVAQGSHPERPWVIVAQQSLFDSSRAPAGKHTAWTYCHVPSGSTVDMTVAVEDQIERFAPGFRDVVIARTVRTPADLERYNENYVGGDIAGGLASVRQFFARPVARLNPYTTPNPRIFFCSSSTPPTAGVHGMCGYWAAKAALQRMG